MIENVSTQLTVFHCFAHCLLPGRAFASLYVLLFLEKEAEIGGRAKSRLVCSWSILAEYCYSDKVKELTSNRSCGQMVHETFDKRFDLVATGINIAYSLHIGPISEESDVSFQLFISYCRLLITFTNSLDPDQARRSVSSQFDTQMVFLKPFF